MSMELQPMRFYIVKSLKSFKIIEGYCADEEIHLRLGAGGAKYAKN